MKNLSFAETFLKSLSHQYRGYWVARRWLYLRLFSAQRLGYGLRTGALEAKFSSSALWSLGGTAMPQVGLALLAAVALQASTIWTTHTFPMVALAQPDEGTYATFLGTVASVAGVFIGLYYTAVTTIAASAYSDLPSGVRSLLAAERRGGIYIRYLAFIACLCTFLLAFRLVGQDKLPHAIPVIALMACFGIIAFVKLGQRVFAFFDPTALSQHVYQQVVESVRTVAIGGYRWRDASFQNHAHVRSRSALQAAAALATICGRREDLRQTSLFELCQGMARTLAWYMQQKSRIPTSSQWYARKLAFGEFFRTDDSVVFVAHRTGSLPMPSQATNSFWLEEQVEKLLLDALGLFLDTGDEENLSDIGSLLTNLVDVMGKAGEAGRAVALIESVVKSIGDRYTSVDSPFRREEKLRLRLIASELVGRSFVQLVLSVRAFAINLQATNWHEHVAKCDLSTLKSVYRFGAPRPLLGLLEDLQKQLSLEESVEGRRYTEDWFLEEHIRRGLAQCIADNVDAMCVQAPRIVELALTFVPEATFPWDRASILRSETEMLSKMAVHLEGIANAHAGLICDHRIQGLQWSVVNHAQLDVAVRSASVKNAIQAAHLVPQLSQLERPDFLPDYAGIFLHGTGEAIMDALLNADEAAFSQMFQSYFDGCIAMSSGALARATQTGTPSEFELHSALAPLAELSSISGYSILLSEAREVGTYRALVEAIWDTYLGGEVEDPSRRARLQILTNFFPMFNDVTFPQHRIQVRFQWSQRVSSALRESLDLPPEHVPYGRQSAVQHASALVRVVARNISIGSMSFSGPEIFRATYLQKYADVAAATGENRLERALKRDQDAGHDPEYG